MAKRPNWRNFGRLSGEDAGRMAVPVYVCSLPGCEVHHRAVRDPETKKWVGPKSCLGCHGMAFDYFASTTEANRWAALRLQEKAGLISGLRRQVPYPLMATAPNGLQIKVALYIADHVYIRDGQEIIEDVKARGGIDKLAQLKLRWMAAQRGEEVYIYAA